MECKISECGFLKAGKKKWPVDFCLSNAAINLENRDCRAVS